MRPESSTHHSRLPAALVVAIAILALAIVGLGVLAADQPTAAGSPAILFAYDSGRWSTAATAGTPQSRWLGVCQQREARAFLPAAELTAQPACVVSVASSLSPGPSSGPDRAPERDTITS